MRPGWNVPGTVQQENSLTSWILLTFPVSGLPAALLPRDDPVMVYDFAEDGLLVGQWECA